MIRAQNVVLAAVALGLVGAVPAWAQTHKSVRSAPVGMPMPRLDAPPPLSPERLARFAAVLELDGDQTKAAEALFDGYTKGVQKQQRKMREDVRRATEDLQDGDRSAIQEKLPEVMRTSGQEAARLRDQFLTDLKSLLRPEQAGNWDRLERLRRRDNFLPRGSLSGSNVDLISVVDALKLAEEQRAGVKEPLGQYEVDVDRPLKEREEFLSAPGDASGSRSFDGESIKKYLEEQRQIDAKVQDVNQRYARQLAEIVPTDKRAVFDDLVKQQSFKRVYKEPSAARKARAAQKLGDLTPAQREALARMLDTYGKAAKPVNDRWASAIGKAEKAGQSPGAPFAAMNGEKPDPALVDAKKARRDLDNSLKQDLEKLLSADQLAQVQSAGQGDSVGGQKMMIAAVGDGSGEVHPFVMGGEDSDDEDEVGWAGAGPGGGVVIIKHEISGNGNGPDEHNVTITTTPPPPPTKKP